jgi:hypothetical protein
MFPPKAWPNVTVKKKPPADAEEREGKPDKLQYFSPNPVRVIEADRLTRIWLELSDSARQSGHEPPSDVSLGS